MVPLIPLAVAAAETAGGAATVDLAATGAITALMGAYMAYVSMTDSSGNGVRVPVTAAAQSPIPAPVASITQSPVTTWRYDAYFGGAHGYGSSPDAAANDWITTYAAGGYKLLSVSETSWSLCGYGGATAGTPQAEANCAIFVYNNQPMYKSANGTSCPAGYVLNGSSCDLVDARAAVADKNTDYARSGTTLSPASANDADAGTNPVKGVVSASGYEVAGTNAQGQPLQVVITPLASGGSQIKITNQGADLAGNTVATAKTITIDSSGQVQSVSQAQTSTALSIDPATQTATTSATGSTANNPTVSTVQFPSDYARTGEAASAANTITPKLDTLHHDLSDTAPVSDPLEPTAAEMPGWGDAFNNLLGWSLPGHVSNCPTGQLDLSGVLGAGHVYAFDAHCQLVDDNFDQLRAAMMVVWSVAALFLLLRA